MNVTSTLIADCIICMGTEQGTVSQMLIKDTESSIASSLASVGENYSKKYLQLFKELFSYKDLPNNWDGYNGIRPKDEIIATVKNFLVILQNNNIYNPEIMLSGEGEIALFWKNKKDYIEVSFEDKDHLTYFYTFNSNFHGEDDIFLDENIPEKLQNAISYLKNEVSSKETDTLTERKTDSVKMIEVA